MNWKRMNPRRLEIGVGVLAAWASIWAIFVGNFEIPIAAGAVLATMPVSAFVAGAGVVRLVGWMLGSEGEPKTGQDSLEEFGPE